VSALRLGLSGCGRLAEAGYLPALEEVPGLQLVAVADPNPARRELIAHMAGAEPYASGAEMAESGRLDAMIVASPAGAHPADAAAASEAGITALVEKPPAAGVTGAVEMASLQHAPWIGFNRRFSALADVRGELPEAGPLELGLEIRYRRSGWSPVQGGDDALADLGPHLADLALWLTGAQAIAVREAHVHPDRAELLLETSRGTALMRCAIDRPHLERVAGAGAERTVGGFARNVIARVRRGEGPLVASLRAELQAYESAVRGEGEGPLATARDGVAVMEVLDAARRAHRSAAPAAIEAHDVAEVAA
jgi:predicted dehydrogenase